MPRGLFLSALMTLILGSAWCEAPWVSLPVPADREAESVETLQGAGIEVLSWSNATVEVSGFEELEQIPLAELTTRLTAQDPRWDPWLKDIREWYRPGKGVSLLWIPAPQREQARQLLGSSGAPAAQTVSPTSPRSVTGWGVVAFTVLFLVLHIISNLRDGWPRVSEFRRWLWAPVSAVFLLAGVLLVGLAPAKAVGAKPVPSVSWLQHRWFQESWPWGAQWKDYAPGKAWAFPDYERKNGRLAEVMAPLRVPDEAWEQTVRGEVKPTDAARIFGTAIP